MSTNPNSGLTGHNNVSATHESTENQGIVPKVMSYIPGLSPSSSRDQASDATAEPAFGAGVGPSGSHSHTGAGSSGLGSTSAGYGSSSTTSGPHSSDLGNRADPRVDSDNSRLGSSNTSGLGSSDAYGTTSTGLGSSNTSGLGSTSAGYGSSTSGPHSSNLANKVDPRIDSDNSRLDSSNTSGLGSSHTSTGNSTFGTDSSNAGYVPAPTLNPHDEERAKVVAARALGGASDPYDEGVRTDHGFSSSGVRDGRVDESSGLGSSGRGSTGAGIGSGVLGSGIGHESSRGSGVGSSVGLGSGAAYESGRASGVGSGIGLESSRESGVGLDSTRGSGVGSGVGLGSDSRTGDHPSTFNDTRRGSSQSREKTHRAVAGESEGATAEESQASATPRHNDGGHNSAKRENKDAIPTAGGIKLGEKHWGESDIVPDNPKPRDENISSASGQPDQSTVENTNRNVGTSSGPPGSGQDKEGLAEKVKHTLHLGGSK